MYEQDVDKIYTGYIFNSDKVTQQFIKKLWFS